MELRKTTYLLVAAFVAFAAWEAIQHVFLMELPMAVYHMVSLTIEFGLVLGIAVVAMGLVRRQAWLQAREHALQDTVVTALAQDLRPPLVRVLTDLHVLDRDPPRDFTDERREVLREATARAGILLGMIEDLVAMATEAGGPHPACTTLSPGELVEAVLGPYRLAARERDLALKVDLGRDAPAVCASADQVLRALSTLLANAVRSTPAGGEIAMRMAASEGEVVFSVTDTAPPVLDRRAALTEAASGPARVGLRYCQTVAEALGGSAWYEPTAGGNSFAFSLPARSDRR
jgi:signal transduction histidine kinase